MKENIAINSEITLLLLQSLENTMASRNQTFTRELKVMLVGPALAGKTHFARSFYGDVGAEPVPEMYHCTIGVEVHPVNMQIGETKVRFNLWECAGKPEFRGLGDAVWLGADAFIVFDPTSVFGRECLAKIHRNYPQAKVVCWDEKRLAPATLLHQLI